MRRKINDERLDVWVKKHKKTLTPIHGKKKDDKGVWKSFSLNVAVGLEMMVYDDNDLEKGLYKTQRYIIEEITDTALTLSRKGDAVIVNHEEFVKIFDYSYCYTMYKIQGITITGAPTLQLKQDVGQL